MALLISFSIANSEVFKFRYILVYIFGKVVDSSFLSKFLSMRSLSSLQNNIINKFPQQNILIFTKSND